MSYKTNLELAYHMGYEDALARKMPDTDKVAVLLPDVADGARKYVYGTDGHEGHWLTGEEIVRCRDCKCTATYGDGIECLGPLVQTWDYYNDQPLHNPVPPDGFCKWGKRKEDA